MRNFRDMVVETEDSGLITKEELLDLIEDLDEDDIDYVAEFVMDVLADNEGLDWDDVDNWDEKHWEEDEEDVDALGERMSAGAKKLSARKRKKPNFKKMMRLKSKCRKKFSKKLTATKGTAKPYVCDSKGKLKKMGMERKDRKLLKKKRKRNKNKITVK